MRIQNIRVAKTDAAKAFFMGSMGGLPPQYWQHLSALAQP